jgi:surface carbohydrate biosynthesis protein (TIGR04326 family)
MADLAIAGSNTSAAVDAYYSNIPLLVILDPRGLNLSPLKGSKEVIFCRSSQAVVDGLQNISRFVKHTHSVESYFSLDRKMIGWKTLINC